MREYRDFDWGSFFCGLTCVGIFFIVSILWGMVGAGLVYLILLALS